MPEALIKLIGRYSLVGLILYIGYKFWDKSFYISVPLISIGIVLSILIIVTDYTLYQGIWKVRKKTGKDD
jgi:hypothetical protein